MTRTSDRIALRGVRFYGHHGVDPAEQDVGQWYHVDLDMRLDLRSAGVTDDLNESVDYGEACRLVMQLGARRRFALIEALAEAIATMVLESFPVEQVWVRVRKTPPSNLVEALAEYGSLDYTAVEIERGRVASD
ncbi:MAG: dihydroneopterin aldolase [Candidatus Poribacteria bacterium]|nr:dihydroneopterin aldolase [Candidatus Poribacteria bacterium]